MAITVLSQTTTARRWAVTFGSGDAALYVDIDLTKNRRDGTGEWRVRHRNEANGNVGGLITDGRFGASTWSPETLGQLEAIFQVWSGQASGQLVILDGADIRRAYEIQHDGDPWRMIIQRQVDGEAGRWEGTRVSDGLSVSGRYSFGDWPNAAIIDLLDAGIYLAAGMLPPP